ncbi:hypothetical protein AB0M57_31810 [Streptomyces sp. NPDC051597]|uniref:hypothetical protein n=1 Tax=Streptomyces sp. NPDC051597 TaxID=3155049 RepID=UPI00343B1A77
MGISDSAARLAAEADMKQRAEGATHRTSTAASGAQRAVGQAGRTVRDLTPAPLRRAATVAVMAVRVRPRQLVAAGAGVTAALLVLRRRGGRGK